MKQESVVYNYTTSYYFGMHDPIVAALGVAAGLFVGLAASSVIGILIVSGAVVVYTTRRGVKIDPANQLYTEYLWLLGFTLGTPQVYSSLEHAYVKKSLSDPYDDRYVGFTGPSGRRHLEYEGYIRVSSKREIYIASEIYKEDLMKKVEAVARDLGLEIIDHTAGQPFRKKRMFADWRDRLYVLTFFCLFAWLWPSLRTVTLIPGICLLSITLALELYVIYRKRKNPPINP